MVLNGTCQCRSDEIQINGTCQCKPEEVKINGTCKYVVNINGTVCSSSGIKTVNLTDEDAFQGFCDDSGKS